MEISTYKISTRSVGRHAKDNGREEHRRIGFLGEPPRGTTGVWLLWESERKPEVVLVKPAVVLVLPGQTACFWSSIVPWHFYQLGTGVEWAMATVDLDLLLHHGIRLLMREEGMSADEAFDTAVMGSWPCWQRTSTIPGSWTSIASCYWNGAIANMHGNEDVKKMKIDQVKKYAIQTVKLLKTIDEEAEYWDTHSILDGISEGTAVEFHNANKTDTMTIRFSHEDIQQLREEAFQQGIGLSTLARMLVRRIGRVTAHPLPDLP